MNEFKESLVTANNNKTQVPMNRYEWMQKRYQEEENKKARQTLQAFTQRVELYLKQIKEEHKDNLEGIDLQEEIKAKFKPEELEQKKIWIGLAIEKVLKSTQEIGR